MKKISHVRRFRAGLSLCEFQQEGFHVLCANIDEIQARRPVRAGDVEGTVADLVLDVHQLQASVVGFYAVSARGGSGISE